MSSYKCVKQRVTSKDLGTYISYGIEVDGRLVFDDVSTDKELVERLVSTLNAEKAELIHLPNILEDWLTTEF